MLLPVVVILAIAAPQTRPAQGLTGGALFAAGCAGCHGPDGSGAPDSTVGFEKPPTYPDFSACDQTSPEVEADWWAVIHDGGKARGFSRIMPAFGELLTSEQITSLVKYIRGLCTDRAWPAGELNFPRAIATEKAFPESETVFASSIDTATHDAVNTLFYERRFGASNQIEIAIPFAVSHDQSGTHHGVGDVGFGLKHVLFSSLNTGSIVSVQGEITAPTGNKDLGLGSGVTVFEAFGAFGQRLGRDGFLQGQFGAELPSDTIETPNAVYGRLAIGSSLRADRRLGRLFVPMLELVADRDLEDGAKTNVDIVPQMQVSLNRRQHVRASLGVYVPATNRSGRSTQVAFYVLWDWFDGGLFDGWK